MMPLSDMALIYEPWLSIGVTKLLEIDIPNIVQYYTALILWHHCMASLLMLLWIHP